MKHKTLTSYWFKKTAQLLAITVLMVGLVWFIETYSDYRQAIGDLRQEHVEKGKQKSYEEVNRVVSYLNFRRSMSEVRLRNDIRQMVDSGVETAANIHKQTSYLSEPKQTTMIVESLRHIRINWGRSYYFIVDSKGKALLYPINPAKEGEVILNDRDAGGRELIKEIVGIVKSQGKGYIDYLWPKLNDLGRAYYKISYVSYYKPLDLIIGMGDYVDDFEKREKQYLLEWLGELTYSGGDGYFYVLDDKGNTLANRTDKENVGLNALEMTDAKGSKFIAKIMEKAKTPGGGYTTYWWERPGNNMPEQKISYSVRVADLGWIIGTGFYLNDVEEKVNQRRDQMINKSMLGSALMLAGLLAVFSLVVVLEKRFTKRLEHNFLGFKRFFERAVESDVLIDRDKVEFEELDILAGYANQMINQRKEFSDALAISEDRLKSSLIATNEGWWDWDYSNGEVYFSPQYYQLHGYQPGEYEASYENWLRFVHPEDKDRVHNALEEHLHGITPEYQAEFRFARRDGSWMWVLARAKVIKRDISGQALRISGTHTDISRRKLAEEDLLASRNLLSQTQYIARLGGWEHNMATGRTFWTDQVFTLLEITSYESGEVYLEGDAQAARIIDLARVINAVLRDKQKVEFEQRLQTAKGRYIWVRVIGLPTIENNRVIKISGFVQDITKAKQTELELQKSEATLKGILKAAPVGIGLVKSRVISWGNPQMVHLFGYSEEELIGTSVKMLYPQDESYEQMGDKIYQILNTKGRTKFENKYKHKDGHLFDAAIYMAILVPNQPENGYIVIVEDITDRHQQEQQLETSIRRWREAQAIGQVANWEVDLTEQTIWMSEQAYRMMGISSQKEKIPAKDFIQLIDEDLAKKQAAKIEYALKNNTHFDMDYPFIRPDGQEVWMHSYAQIIRNQQGEPIKIVGTVQDTTAQVESRKKLADSEQRYRRLFEDAVLGIFRSSRVGIIKEINPAFAHMFGYDSIVDMVGDNGIDAKKLYRDQDVRNSIIEQINQTDEPVIAEVDFVKKDGHVFNGTMHIWAVHDPASGQEWLEGFVEDITERKRTLAALQDSREQLSLAFSAANEGLWDWDRARGFKYFSPTLYTMLGYKPFEFRPTSRVWESLIHPEDRERVLASLQKTFTVGGRIEAEFRIQRKNTSWAWVLFRGQVVSNDSDGRPLRMIGTQVDISERRRLEQESLEREKIFRLLFEQSGWANMLMDNGLCMDANRKALELYGMRTVDEILGHSLSEFSPALQPDGQDSHMLINSYQINALKNGVAFFEWQSVRKTGEEFYAEILLTAIPYQGKQILHVSMQNITGRRLAEETLRHNEQKYRLIASHTGNIIYEYDIATQVLTRSDNYTQITGWPQADGKEASQSWVQFLHPDDQGRVRRALAESLRNTTPFTAEYRYRCADGDYIYIEDSGTFLLNSEGQVTRMFGSMKNITDRKLMENQLLQTRNYLTDILDSMPSAVIGINTDMLVTQFNNMAASLTSKNPEQVVGKGLLQAVPSLTPYYEDIKTALAHKRQLHKQRITMTDQADKYFDMMIFPLTEQETDGAVLRIDDVTQRVQLQEMMVETEKMMSVGGLAAGMAHEINNPLGGILSGVQNTRRRLSTELRANREVADELGCDLELMHQYLEQRSIMKYLDGIEVAGLRAAKIVKNMLNFSRRSDSTHTLVDLNELLDYTIDLASNDYDLKKHYDFRNIKVVKQYQSDMPSVPCMATEIEQVVLNLLKNAAQAFSELDPPKDNPVITITTSVEVKFAHIQVSDNGPGMPEPVRKRIFEPFFTTKDVGMGTGLGLSVSFFIITQNHKGSINVESELGKGTTFHVRIPLR